MLVAMPHDVWAGIAGSLQVREVGQVAPCCKATRDEASDAEFWFNVFMRTCWPRSGALLAFAEGGSADPTSVDWRARLLSRALAAPALVVDIGRGYSKYGIVHGLRGRPVGDNQPPRLVQHCSSPTHPPDCDHTELLSFIHRELDEELTRAALDPSHPLRSAAVGGTTALAAECLTVLRGLVAKPELNGRTVRLTHFCEERSRWAVRLMPPPRLTSNNWAAMGSEDEMLLKPENLVPIRRAGDLPLLIGEPFACTASRGQTGEYDTGTSSWARSVLGRLLSRTGPVHIVPQAQMALWSFGVNHGIVVNIGQGQTISIPVIDGEIGASMACSSDVASGQLTQFMRQLLSQRFDWFDGRHLTFSRDLKEEHCYVAPPSLRSGTRSLQTRIADGEDVGVRSVTVEGPATRNGRAEDFELGVERSLVPELLFDAEMGGNPTLPDLIIDCAAKAMVGGLCDAEGVRRLFRQIVLVGGAADIPGIRPRTEHELRARFRERRAPTVLLEVMTDADDVFVLNPPLTAEGPLTSPRFVPFIGGCVRAVSSERLLPITHATVLDPDQQLATENRWRTFMNLDGPAIFRTGGGGGEDDRVWTALRLALTQQLLRERGMDEEGADDDDE